VSQLALFDDQAVGPAGLRYAPEFISAADEQELIAGIAALPLQPFQFGAFEGHRRVKSFGFRYDYTLQKLTPSEPIPDWLERTARAVERFGELSDGSVRQVLCTEYDVGVGIGRHRDKPHFDKVFGLSLASDCKFRFRRKRGEKWERFTLPAEARSLYLMSGESRQVWEHSIPPVEALRMSVTFRTMAGHIKGPTDIERRE
jgi:alkylated DNA repair dioxygenase AlkB